MEWTVYFSNKANKQTKKLNRRVLTVLRLLAEDLKTQGPAPGKGWSNYGKLKTAKNRDLRHCHLIKSSPTYVCCWEIIDKQQKIIEVYYVGSHEKSPY